MATTLLTLRTDVRNRLDEPSFAQWTDQELTNWINEGCRDIARRAEILETSDSFAVTAGTAEYNLDTNVVRVYRATWTPAGQTMAYPLGYQDFNAMDAAGWSWTTAQGYPSVFTLWGYAPQLHMTLYPNPSVSGTITYWFYKYPTDAVLDSDSVDIPNGWQDIVALYCEYVALRKDTDPRWTDAKQLYEAAVMDMVDRTRRWSDQAGSIQVGSAWLPGWLWNQADY